MTSRPRWRRAFDAAERTITPRVEALVRTSEFSRSTAWGFGVRAAARTGVTDLSTRVWHALNLPAATDIQRLRSQVGAVDRDIRRLSLRLESLRVEQAQNGVPENGSPRAETGSTTSPGAGPQSLLDRVKHEVERNALRTRNGIRLTAGALLESRPNVGLTPKRVVWRRGRCELWHYTSTAARVKTPVLIVFSLISRSYILDLSPGNSFIQHLLDADLDVYMLDWGVPDERDAANRLEDYVDDYIPAAIQLITGRSGSDQVNLLGYCFGGNLALLHAAHHPESPLHSLTVMATPVDFRHVGPLGDLFANEGLSVDDMLDENGNVSAQVVYRAFRMLTPTSDASRYATLWEKLWSDEYVETYQAMTRWVADHIPFPGAAARESVDMFVHENAMMTDRLRVGDDDVHLSDIRVPFLTVLATRDHIVPPEAAAPLIDLVGSTDKRQLRLDAGHMGLVVGRTASRTTVPMIIEYLSRDLESTTSSATSPQPKESG